MMFDQKRLIEERFIEGDIDVLILLDACRYDMFEEMNIWGDENLVKARSPSSNTLEWLSIMFPDGYDITVYSGNPRIRGKTRFGSGYHAGDHFKKVVDIWHTDWDEELGTVWPGSMLIRLYNVEDELKGKNIIWFLQPHYPFLGKHRLEGPHKDLENGKYDEKYLKAGYKENLGMVIDIADGVRDVIEGLGMKWAITSDHGDLLGDKGLPTNMQYGHYKDSDHPLLRTVPWLEL